MKEKVNDIEFSIDKIEEKEDGNVYRIKVKIPASYGFIDNMYFITESNIRNHYNKLDFVKHEDGYVYFAKDVFLQTSAIYHYYFTYDANSEFKYIKNKHVVDDKSIIDEEKWKLSVNFKTPDWAKGKIMYHIFVDRFNRAYNPNFVPMEGRVIHKSFDEEMQYGPDKEGRWNTDFYGGNLRGIINKLDYIKSLGTSIIYLSPIVESQSNHRYDAGDFEKVDPYLGSDEDLRELCNKAHSKGMKVIVDAVFNHTGNDSKYFNEYNRYKTVGAFQSRESPYYDYYRHHEYGDQTYFDYWWGVKTVPACNSYSKMWQDYIYGKGGIADRWISLGVDGFRLDVPDELSDEFIEGTNAAFKRNNKDGIIIGEVWEDVFSKNRGYISSGKGMHSVMNYYMVNPLMGYFKYGDVDKIRGTLKNIENRYPNEIQQVLMNFTSTHDIPRPINVFGTDDFQRHAERTWLLKDSSLDYIKHRKLTNEEYKRGKEIYKSYVYTLTFFPGILSIFYGDEIGMEGLTDPSNRKPFNWKKRDEELFKFFQNIGKIRNKETFLEKADMNVIDINDKFILFERKKDEEKALIAVNRSNETIKTPITKEYLDADYSYNLNDSNKEVINPHGGYVLKKVKK